MFGRLIVLIMGLAGGATLSQGPEFAQQYRQNLNGRVAELSIAVQGLRRDADRVGLTVEEALSDLGDSGRFGQLRAQEAKSTWGRYERLEAHQKSLNEAGPFMRLITLAEGYDKEIADNTLQAFEPAAPITIEGVAHAGAGFIAGSALGGFLMSGLGAFRPRRRSAA